MKFNLIIDKQNPPSVTVVCPAVNATVKKIEELCSCDDQNSAVLYGYDGYDVVTLELDRVSCFCTDESKVFCFANGQKFATKLRIKNVLEMIDDRFVKINQGCVVNVNQIEKFTASIGGSLKVVLKNGFSDYVSRRELTNVKRRLGL